MSTGGDRVTENIPSATGDLAGGDRAVTRKFEKSVEALRQEHRTPGPRYAFLDTRQTRTDAPAGPGQKPNVPNWKGEPLKDMATRRGLLKAAPGAGIGMGLYGLSQALRPYGLENLMRRDVGRLAADHGVKLDVDHNPYHRAIAEEYTQNRGDSELGRLYRAPMTGAQALDVVKYRLHELEGMPEEPAAAPKGLPRSMGGGFTDNPKPKQPGRDPTEKPASKPEPQQAPTEPQGVGVATRSKEEADLVAWMTAQGRSTQEIQAAVDGLSAQRKTQEMRWARNASNFFPDIPERPSQRALDPVPGSKLTADAKDFVTVGKHGDFNTLPLGNHGEDSTKLLWTIDRNGAHFVPETKPWDSSRGIPSHTNISDAAYFAGEAWRTGPNEITVNSGSRAFGYNWQTARDLTRPERDAYISEMQQRYNSAVNYFESLGFKVKVVPLGER